MSYTQLTQEERYQIYILKKVEYSQAQIADLLERDKSTISRELSRNRGLNENTNGLLRQYFPKNRELTTVTHEEIEQAMDKLNHRPRKTLAFVHPMRSSSRPRLR